MLADEDSQFHMDSSPNKRLKNEETTKKPQNICAICQKKKGNNLVSVTRIGKNTLLLYVNRAEDDIYRRLKKIEGLKTEKCYTKVT